MAKILVLNGDAATRGSLVTILRRRGHQVQEASSGAEALAITRATLPDLIITDVMMPEMDAYEFARQLRTDAKVAHIRLIFYTANYHRASARALAEACGVACILARPSEPELILETVDSVLKDPAPQAESVLPAFHEDHARVLRDKIFNQLDALDEANKRLDASEKQYRALFETNPFPMWIVDEESQRFLAVNHAATRHYGYSPEEFERISVRDVSPAADSAALLAEPREDQSEFPRVARIRKHRTKAGSLIDVAVFDQATSFEGRPARLELVQDVTERNRAERKLRESAEQLHHLTERVWSAQEEERMRVARYLHDELGQMLTALRMTCGWMKRRLPAGQADLAEKVQSCIELTDEMVVAVQGLATDLRPGILDIGIGAAIDWHVREFQARSDIACTVQVPEDEEPTDPICATEVYRIFQEALANIARHSGATKMNVELKREPTGLLLEVRDNGRGITPGELASPGSLGILGMRERAALIGGAVAIEGNPNSGTTVRITVPASAAS